MSIGAISSSSMAMHQLTQVQNTVPPQAQQAMKAGASDPDNDGDTDGPGPDTNDSRGRTIDVKA